MHKRRLIKSQQHPVDRLMDYMTNNKPFDINEVGHSHDQIKSLVNEASDQAHMVTQLTKGNAGLFNYYNAIYQKLNQISNSLDSTNPNHLT